MKRLLFVFFVSLMAVSCVNLKGELNVLQAFDVKTKSGLFNHDKMIKLESGIYGAELKLVSEKKLKLVLKPADGKEITIPIKSENDLNIPTQGDFTILGSTIDQLFDIEGHIVTTVTTGPQVQTSEACTIQYVQPVCTVINHVYQCHDQTVTYPGRRYVTYHMVYTARDLDLNFVNSEKLTLAQLGSSGTEAKRVDEYIGPCYQ